MRLADLVQGILDPGPAPAGLEIAAVTADSRKAAPGALFAALPGSRADGARFAADAVGRGAVAILAGAGADVDGLGVPVLRAPDPRRAQRPRTGTSSASCSAPPSTRPPRS